MKEKIKDIIGTIAFAIILTLAIIFLGWLWSLA